MRNNIAIVVALAGALFAGSFALAQEATGSTDASSQAEARITFPIPELGNCASKNECKAYCEDAAHTDSCISFAEAHGLMKKEEVARARSFSQETGPGGCKGIACKKYCDDPAHTDECIAFAKDHNLISAKDVQIAQTIKSGGGPGGCDSMSACWNYCADSSHSEECTRFARENGLEPPHSGIPDRAEIDKRIEHDRPHIDEDKARQILSEKGGPGGCKTMDECKNYCEEGSHMDECMRFAQENGLMSADDVARAKKFIEQPGPGGCRGEACRAYCSDETHQDECTSFAVDHGFMSKEEAGRVRKFRDIKGPGGCTGEACRTYCEDPAHRDECTAFAVQNGFMTQEQADRMQNTHNMTGPGGCTGEACRTYCEDPAHRDECISFAKERGMMGPPPGHDQRPEGQMPAEDQQDQQGSSTEHSFAPPGSGDHESTHSMHITGPGGCTTPAECENFCKNNPDQCKGGPADMHGGGSFPRPPSNMTPEERQRYERYQQNIQDRQQPQDVTGPQPQHYPDQYPDGSSPAGHIQPPYPQQYQGQPGISPGTLPQQYQNQTPPPPTPQYQPAPGQPGTPPAGSGIPSQGAPSTPPPPPPSAPTSAIPPSDLVASVFSIFSRLLGGFIQ